MDRQGWNNLRERDYDAFVDAFFGFMRNKKNICNCEHCPENVGIKEPNYFHMCGQQNCSIKYYT